MAWFMRMGTFTRVGGVTVTWDKHDQVYPWKQVRLRISKRYPIQTQSSLSPWFFQKHKIFKECSTDCCWQAICILTKKKIRSNMSVIRFWKEQVQWKSRVTRSTLRYTSCKRLCCEEEPQTWPSREQEITIKSLQQRSGIKVCTAHA